MNSSTHKSDSATNVPLRILHVTETAAGGLITVLASFSKRQMQASASPTIYYMERPEGPASTTIPGFFESGVGLRSFTAGGSKLKDYAALSRELLRVFNTGSYDVVHAHSSKAGFLARVLWLASRRKSRVFYSPHGFAFLRLDTSPLVRRAVRLTEQLLARVSYGLILTCESEHALAVDSLHARNAVMVTTGVDESVLDPSAVKRKINRTVDRPLVVCVARVSYQKAPWRFANVARALSDRAEFVWIGSGEPEDEQRWLGDAPVRITGWLSPEELRSLLDRADVLLFPTLWEGMPLSLIQAQAQGIPAVVSDVVGNRDAVLHGETGFVCTNDQELISRTRELVVNHELRRKMALATQDWVAQNHTDRALGFQSITVYRGG